jgi:hypothetical protein
MLNIRNFGNMFPYLLHAAQDATATDTPTVTQFKQSVTNPLTEELFDEQADGK